MRGHVFANATIPITLAFRGWLRRFESGNTVRSYRAALAMTHRYDNKDGSADTFSINPLLKDST